MADKTIKIAYLYENLMNTYGDTGDVKEIRYLLDKQGYQTEVDNISLDDSFDANDYDFLFFGGGQDFEQTVVAKDLPRHKETIDNHHRYKALDYRLWYSFQLFLYDVADL